MFCPTRGKEIPSGSTFCMYCGSQTERPAAPPSSPHQVKWEYQDLVIEWPEEGVYPLKVTQGGDSGYTLPAARLEYWQWILPIVESTLREWHDQGWQPVGDVSSAAVELDHIRRSALTNMSQNGCLGWLIIISVVIASWGLGLILFALIKFDYVQPARVKIEMRRQVR